ncbi:uncharacterized protein EMH_0080060 [Eimeria mitis]|uniref:Uncharacterized protein n=1 Tax=Eimeria mitis TaxID=44415 RepID=U6KC80_9EIME|nr:uncharacterized protein EMH_0080060 [Eimeria mitis]CDJ33098.1 hypothetical protein EMH_0080060 [Eimeria mitis]
MVAWGSMEVMLAASGTVLVQHRLRHEQDVGRALEATWDVAEYLVGWLPVLVEYLAYVYLRDGHAARVVEGCAGHEVLERAVAAAERSLSLCRVASALLEAVNRLSDTQGWQQSRRSAFGVIGWHEVLERGVAAAERSLSLCRQLG